MKNVWVVDIDTSIADNTHREHLLTKECVVCGAASPAVAHACVCCMSSNLVVPQASWDAFMSPQFMGQDVPDRYAQKVLRKAQLLGIDVHFITGRRDHTRTVTQNWLTEHFGFVPEKNKLLMRTESGPASTYKEGRLKDLMEICGYTDRDLFFFFEDDEHVIPMYAQYGVVLEAPSCWRTMWSDKPRTEEPFIKR